MFSFLSRKEVFKRVSHEYIAKLSTVSSGHGYQRPRSFCAPEKSILKAPFHTFLRARREPRLGASRLNLRNCTSGVEKVKFFWNSTTIKFQTLKRQILLFVTRFLRFSLTRYLKYFLSSSNSTQVNFLTIPKKTHPVLQRR